MIVWSAEWRAARARPRVLALNVAVPLLLVLPIALGGAPAAHAAAVYAVLFTLFGTFGSTIPLVRDAETGILARLALTGYPPRRLLLERILANATLDTLQLAPALAVILLAARPDAALAAALPLVLAATLLTANALGACIAAVARSIAEAALFAAVTALFALHGAGVFRTPAPGSLAAAFEHLSPFRHLHEALLRSAGAAAEPAAPLLAAGATLGAAAALALAAVLAPPLIARLTRPA